MEDSYHNYKTEFAQLLPVTLEVENHPDLKLRACPYIGQYQSFYRWIVPLDIRKAHLKDYPKSLPSGVRRAILGFRKSYPLGEIDYFVISSSAKCFHTQYTGMGMSLARFNYVIHPYAMRDVRKGKEKIIKVKISLYRLNSGDPICSCEEHQAVGVDSDNIMALENLEVHLHPGNSPDLMISPNNASFLMSILHPVLSFFGCTVIPISSREARLVVALHTIISDMELPLLRHLQFLYPSKPIDEKIHSRYLGDLEFKMFRLNQLISNAFFGAIQPSLFLATDLTEIDQTLIKIGILLYTDCPDVSQPKKEQLRIGQMFLDGFYDFISAIFYYPKMKIDFSHRYVAGHKPEYRIELVKKYMRQILKFSTNTFYAQESLLQIQGKAKETPRISREEEKMQGLQNARFPACPKSEKILTSALNPDLAVLEQIIDLLVKGKSIMEQFSYLTEAQKDFMFFRVWYSMGRHEGIHPEFGYHSLFATTELNEYYHVSEKDRFEFFMMIQEVLKKIDSI